MLYVHTDDDLALGPERSTPQRAGVCPHFRRRLGEGRVEVCEHAAVRVVRRIEEEEVGLDFEGICFVVEHGVSSAFFSLDGKGEGGPVLMTLRVKFWTGWWEYSTVRESKTAIVYRQSVEE